MKTYKCVDCRKLVRVAAGARLRCPYCDGLLVYKAQVTERDWKEHESG